MPTLPEPAPDPLITAAVRAGLRAFPKTLPVALLYDELGSALFEAITCLPEYELTRADRRLLAAHAVQVRAIAGLCDLVELGAGSGRKAKLFVDHYAPATPLRYTAIDVSRTALDACRRELAARADVEFSAGEGEYLDGLRHAARKRRDRPLLALFLGSNLSNFDRTEARAFLAAVRAEMHDGDWLLLAADLDKDPARLLAAYDDALGVTAAFNKNLLVRLNRDYGAGFDLAAFRHEARWDPHARRIEMHLVAARAMTVALPGLDLRIEFAHGESIWTESSHRYGRDELEHLGHAAGWRLAGQWIDARWPFAHTLYHASRKLTALSIGAAASG